MLVKNDFTGPRRFIGFCGAGGTGKTSTLQALHKLTGWEMLPSASRGVFEKFKVRREDDQNSMTGEQRWELQHAIQLAHYEQQSNKSVAPTTAGCPIICDRTQWDQFSYAIIQCSPVLQKEDYAWLEALSKECLGFYYAIFYFGFWEYDSLDDGMRTTNYGMRRQFDTTLLGLIKRYGIEYRFTEDGPRFNEVPIFGITDGHLMTPEDRAQWILKQLGKDPHAYFNINHSGQ